MFCPKCGNELPDNSRFCSVCGERVSDAEPEVLFEPNTEANNPLDDHLVDNVSANSSNPEFVPVKKKVNIKIFMIAIIATIIALVAFFGLRALFASFGNNNAYVYLSDGKYELLTNLDLDEDQAIEIDSSKSDVDGRNLLEFTPDGKYLYYYTKYDRGTFSGTLCRAEYGKLQKDTRKNDKYIEVVANNVGGFRLLSDGSAVYTRRNNEGTEDSDDPLYYYNGKESIKIANSVGTYYTDDSNRLVYTIEEPSEDDTSSYTYTLYGVNLKDINNKQKLASNISFYNNLQDFDNILYSKETDEGYEYNYSYDLYVVGFDKEPEQLGKNGQFLTSTSKKDKTYFVAENGTKLHLYDYVEDEYAESDAGITEPNREDFRVPTYSYNMVSGSDLSEGDFDELYTSCTKPLYWYGKSTWRSKSMEDALELDWGEDKEGLLTATQSFIDKFAASADEDGYILVTDEVKAALQEINQYADNPENEWQWMWLCYSREQSGTAIDTDAYDSALAEWNEAKDRIEVREALQDEENDYAVHTLYCYENGNINVIKENVLDVFPMNGGYLFNTTDLISEKVPLERIDLKYLSSRDDIERTFFSINREAENYILHGDSGTISKVSSLGGGYISITEKEVFLINTEDNTLSAAKVNNGVVGDFTVVADDAETTPIMDDNFRNSIGDDSTLYYVGGSYKVGNSEEDGSEYEYYDLYSYSNGTSQCLAKGVLSTDINLYSDGVILAYTGQGSYSGYELTMIDSKGESTIIADNVTEYIRVDESTLLYISDGDLYCYDGKEKNYVKSDVDQVWSLNSMDVLHEFYGRGI
ncbi:zinc ribbon domain-containing protein [Solibaculum mannosilyticum]|uniref:zinc ribbon domain-containing protein n=1 Tax=Solibaculum mannosilyticum TaxID=2780922 RepID=UPI0034C02F08